MWSPLHVALLLGVFSVLIWPAVVVWLIVYAVSSLRRHGRDLARIAARLERIEQRIGAP